MWRGAEAGGGDTGELVVEGNAVMPKDDRARPTTLPGYVMSCVWSYFVRWTGLELDLTVRIITPINVSHVFVYEVFFSVWGEDDMGNPLPEPGPGGLRFLQVQRPVILPSCALIPRILDLPECKSTVHHP